MKSYLKLKYAVVAMVAVFIVACADYGDSDKAVDETALSKERSVSDGIVSSEAFDDAKKVEDEYVFPKLSVEWAPDETVQSRLEALQIPDDVLATISTAGLLETCLNFPYLSDIFFCNDYQQGFEALAMEFNGFRELMKRPDLVKTLLMKYSGMGREVAGIRSRSDVEIGRFSFRHFVLEMTMAQDAVIEEMDAEQEKQLIVMSLERTKTEQANADVFGGMHVVPTSLLYAKKIAATPDAGITASQATFIQAPLHIDPETVKSLEDHVIAKYIK